MSDYSYRNATMGSTFIARRAGTNAASGAIATREMVAPTNSEMSVRLDVVEHSIDGRGQQADYYQRAADSYFNAAEDYCERLGQHKCSDIASLSSQSHPNAEFIHSARDAIGLRTSLECQP